MLLFMANEPALDHKLKVTTELLGVTENTTLIMHSKMDVDDGKVTE